jgi:hypothetical protein
MRLIGAEPKVVGRICAVLEEHVEGFRTDLTSLGLDDGQGPVLNDNLLPMQCLPNWELRMQRHDLMPNVFRRTQEATTYSLFSSATSNIASTYTTTLFRCHAGIRSHFRPLTREISIGSQHGGIPTIHYETLAARANDGPGLA